MSNSTIKQDNLKQLEANLKSISRSKQDVRIKFRGADNNMKALCLNYGTRYIERQPFYDIAKKEIAEQKSLYMKKHLKDINSGKLKMKQVNEYLGKQAVSIVQKNIKKFGLVETGALLNSVYYERRGA